MGHLWGANEERGVFKTTDGGGSWSKVLYFDDRTGVTDLTMDPVDSDIIYAAAHERTRDRYDSGDPVDQWGPHAGIYVTRNGGADWTRSTEGLPAVEVGRIGIDSYRLPLRLDRSGQLRSRHRGGRRRHQHHVGPR